MFLEIPVSEAVREIALIILNFYRLFLYIFLVLIDGEKPIGVFSCSFLIKQMEWLFQKLSIMLWTELHVAVSNKNVKNV